MNKKILWIIGIVLLLMYMQDRKEAEYDDGYRTQFDFNLPTPALLKETRSQGEYNQKFSSCQPSCMTGIPTGNTIDGIDDYGNSYSCPTYKGTVTIACPTGYNVQCSYSIGPNEWKQCGDIQVECATDGSYNSCPLNGETQTCPDSSVTCGGPIFQDVWEGTCTVVNYDSCYGNGCTHTSTWDCNDGTWKTHGKTWSREGDYGPSGTSDAYAEGGVLKLIGGRNAGASSSEYLIDLSDVDVKIDLTSTLGGTINFGGNSILLPSNTCDSTTPALVELEKSILNENLYYIKVNGRIVRNVSIIKPSYLRFTQDSCSYVDNNGYTQYGGSMTIYSPLKSRLFFSCELKENEVFVKQTFGPGVSFTIQDLTFWPNVTKFCLDSYPAVLRNVTAGARADLRGEITKALASGETITVPLGTYLEITYATFYQVGIDDVCSPGEVYDLETKTCSQFLSDRPPEYIMIREHEYITIGSNQHYFTDKVIFGDERIISLEPEFVCNPRELENSPGDCYANPSYCQSNEECTDVSGVFYCRDKEPSDWNAPFPQDICWQGKVRHQKAAYPYNSINSWDNWVTGTSKDLNQYLNLALYISAHYESDIVDVESYTNSFVLTLKNRDFIQLNEIKENELAYWVIKGSGRQLCFDVTNNLVNWNGAQAGYYLKKNTRLVQTEETEWLPMAINKVQERVCFGIDDSMYNEITYEIVPYFYIGDEMFFDDERLVYNYNIVDEIPLNQTVIYQDRDCRDVGYKCPANYECNQGTGLCVGSIIKDCTTEGCASGEICNAVTGVCEKEIVKDCRATGCAYGTCTGLNGNFVCLQETDCLNTGCPPNYSCELVYNQYVCKEKSSSGGGAAEPNMLWLYIIGGIMMFILLIKSMKRR